MKCLSQILKTKSLWLPITVIVGFVWIASDSSNAVGDASVSENFCHVQTVPTAIPVSDKPYDTPRYKTKDMRLDLYSGENLPSNTVWQKNQVTYLNETQRVAYQLFVKSGKIYRSDGRLFDTSNAQSVHSTTPRAMFVMDYYGRLYASDCQAIGNFHHTSFLSGGPVAAAGELEAKGGIISLTTRRSGHYRPDISYQDQLFLELRRQGIATQNITRIPGF